MLPDGRRFFKMSGSGNDFVMVDATHDPADWLLEPSAIQAICARATGVGADGLVILAKTDRARFKMIYMNSDGSRADLCGNASLCSARLARELGVVTRETFTMETDAGVLTGRFVDGAPEIDLPPVAEVRAEMPFGLEKGEHRIGFAVAGVPHLVVRTDDISLVQIIERGRPLRSHASLPHGANVNFVSRDSSGRWHMRTYERGVEGETLACGTGSVATAILLAEAGEVAESVELGTRSGKSLRVRLARCNSAWQPSLMGEARIVFEGRFGEI